ncbi:unnamed protein product [Trichogramma brassicae]|uniref:Uncharacterized protein n=1 Tax=Trichogramma brassicae TaxID=86971 RepID=A0A6H5I011_9HYME|nr:unnamed protein product [Trichogramma brassicae]
MSSRTIDSWISKKPPICPDAPLRLMMTPSSANAARGAQDQERHIRGFSPSRRLRRLAEQRPFFQPSVPGGWSHTSRWRFNACEDRRSFQKEIDFHSKAMTCIKLCRESNAADEFVIETISVTRADSHTRNAINQEHGCEPRKDELRSTPRTSTRLIFSYV